MKKALPVIALFALAGLVLHSAARRSTMKHPHSGREIVIPGRDGDGTLLFNGWRVSPAGRSQPAGDMILGAAVSPDGKTLAMSNSGYGRHKVTFIDVATEKEIASFPMDRSWSGLVWSPDGKRVFVSGGIENPRADILAFQRWDEKGWAEARSGYSLVGADRAKTAVSGLALSADGATLYAVNNSDDHLYILETRTGRGVARLRVGDHPLACELSKDGRRLYVANLAGGEVAVVDVSAPEGASVVARLPTDPHPNDLAISGDGRLFVSCGNANSVLAFDLGTGARMETINTSLSPKAPGGSTPDAVSLSPDGKRLFVANADNNNIAVVDIEERGRSKVLGFVPTGWYPTSVLTTADGKRLIVASGKGTGTGPNRVQRPLDKDAAIGFLHHGNNLAGLISFIDMPGPQQLAAYTRQVYANTPFREGLLSKAEFQGGSVVPTRVGAGSPIQHILYIIKENRTYDQVFGDLPQGNGDPSLVLFGRDVTPNQHALAEQFVLFDNLYCSGEVSQDGHPWSTSAYVTDFTQRSWLLRYSRHGFTAVTRAAAEQSTPYIWEAATKKGLSVLAFSYGGRRGLEDKQSQLFDRRKAPDEATRNRDFERADRFAEELAQLDRENRVPNLMIMSLGENHTNGTRPGSFTPKAMVASNDVAVGKIVEAVMKSKVWPKSAIFIIEDDAQNGPDHIDSHRTAGLVISPYAKRGYVDSTMYTTVSMLRTIGLLLGLPPLTQYDAAATPMFEAFSDKADLSGFTPLPARIDLFAKNPANAYGAAESAKMNWDTYDQIDEDLLNRILWHSIKGLHVAMPAPVRRALPGPHGVLQLAAD